MFLTKKQGQYLIHHHGIHKIVGDKLKIVFNLMVFCDTEGFSRGLFVCCVKVAIEKN